MGSAGILPHRSAKSSAWVRCVLLCGALVGAAFVAIPAQGADPTDTFYGTGALARVTTGVGDSAFGYFALNSDTDGSYNTASGTLTLLSNTTGDNNTASGFAALVSNTTGNNNTGTGFDALFINTTGSFNVASGYNALYNNTTGGNNSADGSYALNGNTTGANNTANGRGALYKNTTASNNTAEGYQALNNNTTGHENTASGMQALVNNTTGSNNTALGASAGSSLTTGSNNIDIGALGANGESNTIRIGRSGFQTAAYMTGVRSATVPGGVTVMIDSSGHLGTLTSSARYKDHIQPMDKASEPILSLQPVTFRYKKELDPNGIPQFGLVAEQVEKVNPDLVARDDQGKPYTVRYEAINAMLLNEFLKEHRKVEEQTEINKRQEATITRQQQDFHAAIAKQQEEIQALTAALQAQAARIQKVSDQLAVSQNAPATLVDNR